MVLSPIPMFGLPHLVNVVEPNGTVDDGMGGISPGNDVSIYTNRRCRIAKRTGEHTFVPAGFDGPDVYVVIFEFSDSLSKDQIIVVTAGTAAAMKAPAGRYRIVWVDQRIDHLGGNHHTSVVMEKT